MPSSLARITPTADAADLAGCDPVIEAVFEDPSLKHEGVRRGPATSSNPDACCARTPPRCRSPSSPRASTGPRTSSACTSSRPVDKMPLVEIIRGEQDLRRGRRPGVRRRPADPQDPDRRQRQPRLLHLPGLSARCSTRAWRMLGEGVDPQTSSGPRRMAGYPAPPLQMHRRVSLTLSQQDPQRHRTGRRSATVASCPRTPATAVIDPMVEVSAATGKAARVPGSTTTTAGRRQACGPGCASTSPHARAPTSRCATCRSAAVRRRPWRRLAASTRASSTSPPRPTSARSSASGSRALHRRRGAVHQRLRGRPDRALGTGRRLRGPGSGARRDVRRPLRARRRTSSGWPRGASASPADPAGLPDHQVMREICH